MQGLLGRTLAVVLASLFSAVVVAVFKRGRWSGVGGQFARLGFEPNDLDFEDSNPNFAQDDLATINR